MIITNDIIKSSYFCLFKTDLKINRKSGNQTEYEKMEIEIKKNVISKYIFINENSDSIVTSDIRLKNKSDLNFKIAINVLYSSKSYSIYFDAIEKIDGNIFPVYFSPNSTITKYEKEYISCLSYILNTELSSEIKTCKIVYIKDTKLITQKVQTAFYQKAARKKISEIKKLTNPEFCLTKNCMSCEFNTLCQEKAKNENHLSLLNRATQKIIDKYKKKGIFTVNQLSYLYKPRRRRKDTILLHNIELQALAIRTKKYMLKLWNQ